MPHVPGHRHFPARTTRSVSSVDREGYGFPFFRCSGTAGSFFFSPEVHNV